ncbi:hypothetical protein F3J38_26240 [Pantoea sp. Acro-805]|uniref:Uncharacterized protein n=1 Tax=Candidatus Pantoea formicae TaxID=2608355 RepID=A0ABX0R5T8_9GAMM|nr:hypothetical protein [Pantoea formicae]NIF03505.1 hypothetical protein [Pantoea formicae]
MNRLHLIIMFFMTGIILNCLRQLLAYSVSLTYDVLIVVSVACFALMALGIFTEVLAHRRARRGPGGHHEA